MWGSCLYKISLCGWNIWTTYLLGTCLFPFSLVIMTFPRSTRQTAVLFLFLSFVQLPKSIRLNLLWSTFTGEGFFWETQKEQNNASQNTGWSSRIKLLSMDSQQCYLLPGLVLLSMCCWHTCRVKNMWQWCWSPAPLPAAPELREARAASSRKAALSAVGALSTLLLQSCRKNVDNSITTFQTRLVIYLLMRTSLILNNSIQINITFEVTLVKRMNNACSSTFLAVISHSDMSQG